MLKSMTAYGRASHLSPIGRFVVEIQSVNRKFLEINVLLPKELLRFDNEIKKLIGTKIFRGQVSVKISAYFDQNTPLVVAPNLALARQIKGAWDAIAEDLRLPNGDRFSLEMLTKEQGVLLYGEDLHDEQLYRTALTDLINQALEDLVEMRQEEGKALQQDISSRLTNMRLWMNKITERSHSATDKYRLKLIERLEQLKPGITQDEERILREVCLFADRIDITEEITRFHSHLDQFEKLIQSNANGVGKTLEFILQEMNREVNTMASKSSDVDVSHLVIDIKSDLERVREQIQNVE
jgi:uncharacterized protein (TIGR00255 family)